MDLIEGLAKQASQITMYDVKSYYNQAKNVILNVSEMEAKVREATNDDPWGASSTLMQQIADGTHNFAQFNEIMPTIYARFMEKEAREWRQIYKALTLLEFLVKNGSERVVDDARAHISTIKMLRSFHYIDEKSKDQGINVRNRASEIALLLADVERIRSERRKAKSNKSKYAGVGNDGLSFVTSTGSRFGGFGSDSLGGTSSFSGGDGGSSRRYEAENYRSSSHGFQDSSAQAQFDEYEGADDFDAPPKRTTSISRPSARSGAAAPPKPVAKEPEPEKPKEVNLFDFDDEPISSLKPVASFSAAPEPSDADDDFDDFQSAAPAPPTQTAKPANSNVFDLLNSSSLSAPPQQAVPTYSSPVYSPPVASTPSYNGFTSPALTANSSATRPPLSSQPSVSTPAALSPKPTGGSSTFDDLFASSLSSIGKTANQQKSSGGKTIKDLEKEKMESTLWGANPAAASKQPTHTQPKAPAKPAGDFDDLLM